VGKHRVEVREQSPIDFWGRLRNGHEAFFVMSVYADGQALKFLEVHEAHELIFRRDRQVREKVISAHIRMSIKVGKLFERMFVHEHVAGARREMEAIETNVYRLIDAIKKHLVRHGYRRALLLLVRTEAALEITVAARLDIKGPQVCGNEFAPEHTVDEHLDPDEIFS